MLQPVSRSEFEALKRFGDYEELSDGTLMRMEGNKEFRIYCEDVEGCPISIVTEGVLNLFADLYVDAHPREGRSLALLSGPQRSGGSPCLTFGPTFVTLRQWKRTLSASDSGQRPEGPKAISYQSYEENARHNIS